MNERLETAGQDSWLQLHHIHKIMPIKKGILFLRRSWLVTVLSPKLGRLRSLTAQFKHLARIIK
ncbi:MAG: hypothetical protein ACYSYV_08535 [Planctomycetota bacterium]